MSRIRTIKPEFPQSETIGRLSRDARLLFIQLWTIADDAGRARGASRALASLLYPYDDDAPKLIDGWLAELEDQLCIARYEVEGSTYLEITNWLKHQKIDRPSKSRLPSFDESSRVFVERSRALDADLGPSTLDHGPSIPSPSETASQARRSHSEGVDWEDFSTVVAIIGNCSNGTERKTIAGIVSISGENNGFHPVDHADIQRLVRVGLLDRDGDYITVSDFGEDAYSARYQKATAPQMAA